MTGLDLAAAAPGPATGVPSGTETSRSCTCGRDLEVVTSLAVLDVGRAPIGMPLRSRRAILQPAAEGAPLRRSSREIVAAARPVRWVISRTPLPPAFNTASPRARRTT